MSSHAPAPATGAPTPAPESAPKTPTPPMGWGERIVRSVAAFAGIAGLGLALGVWMDSYAVVAFMVAIGLMVAAVIALLPFANWKSELGVRATVVLLVGIIVVAIAGIFYFAAEHMHEMQIQKDIARVAKVDPETVAAYESHQVAKSVERLGGDKATRTLEKARERERLADADALDHEMAVCKQVAESPACTERAMKALSVIQQQSTDIMVHGTPTWFAKQKAWWGIGTGTGSKEKSYPLSANLSCTVKKDGWVGAMMVIGFQILLGIGLAMAWKPGVVEPIRIFTTGRDSEGHQYSTIRSWMAPIGKFGVWTGLGAAFITAPAVLFRSAAECETGKAPISSGANVSSPLAHSRGNTLGSKGRASRETMNIHVTTSAPTPAEVPATDVFDLGALQAYTN